MSAKQTKTRVLESQVKALERALLEERTALAAITKVMLLECPDPTKVLARLDAMTRAAETTRGVTPAMRRQMIMATKLVREAMHREMGRPQELFEPDVGPVRTATVDKLVGGSQGHQQLGLVTNEGIEDAETAHVERVAAIQRMHDVIVELFAEGSCTDRELHVRYWRAAMRDRSLIPCSEKAIADRRKELTASGRVVRKGEANGITTWGLVEAA